MILFPTCIPTPTASLLFSNSLAQFPSPDHLRSHTAHLVTGEQPVCGLGPRGGEMNVSCIIIWPGVILCGCVMFLTRPCCTLSGSGWIKAASYRELHQETWTDVSCLWLHNLLRSRNDLRPPPLVSDVSGWCGRISPQADLALEKVTRACHEMLRSRVTTDIGSKCRNKCQSLSPFTSDGDKQPRVKWTLIGPVIDTLPRLTFIYLH